MLWNSEQWKEQFERLSTQRNAKQKEEVRFLLRNMRADVFKHTVFLVQQGYYFNEEQKKINFPDASTMMAGTKFYDFLQTVHHIPTMINETIVKVENIDCLLAAENLLNEGYHPAVLNMASRQNPGGGVQNGAGAQEENLFRRSNLFQSLYQFAPFASNFGLHKSKHQYPLDRNFGGIYTPHATVFRGTEQDGYPLLDTPYQMSFIAVAGINRPALASSERIAPELVEPVKNKIRTIFRIGLLHGHDSLVLGALGCGAFRNPPSHIARLFHEVMEEKEFKNKYRLLLFAILDDHNARLKHNPDGNFLPFVREFDR
ncbi:MAG: TIGR02452 family protein [Bacteroidaceae bacterium]|nr:TIGR02452 family protein [Bacteroidaceae bacterium]